MYKLIDNNGREITDTKKMVEETRKFYEKLYEKKIVQDINIEELASNVPKLDQEKSETLEGFITYEEATEVLKNIGFPYL